VKRLLFLLLAPLPLTAFAEIYKWVDDKGAIHYSDKRPEKRAAKVVDVTPQIIETSRLRALRDERAPEQGASERDLGPPPVRGLDFGTFIRLERGMTEGEVLARAGVPDIQNVEGAQEFSRRAGAAGRRATSVNVVKSYSYLPTPSDPFITVITFSGGRVVDLDRVRKF
jgi:hypothetical protein